MPSPTTPGSSPSTPSPVTVNSDAIKVINDQSTQAYYLSFVLDNVDDCAMNIQSVQIESSGTYRDNDQYYYDGGHKYAFDYDQLTSFDAMLPITLRIVLSSGEAIVLTDIITDLTGGNVFTSSKTCDGSETNTDTPAPTVPGQTPMPTMNAQNPVPTQSPSVQPPAPTIADGDIADTTSDDTTPDLGNPS